MDNSQADLLLIEKGTIKKLLMENWSPACEWQSKKKNDEQ